MCRWCEFEKLFKSWSLWPSLVMWWLQLSLIVWSANHTWHDSLKSTIYVVSLYLSQVSKLLIMPYIWKRENQLMALDKKSDSTRFGSRSYTFLDWETTEKGDWKREITIWNNLSQPTYTGRVRYAIGRVRYERDYKTQRTPSAKTDLSLSNRPSRCLPPHLGRPRISPKREREREIALEKACIKIEGPRIWISHRLLISSLKVP